ncbi:hypothetical protein AQUCO_03500141v1 [Aquilegia coerulea]|uniref:Ubiquitin-like domain-containing protein n=1 Tax=Aquilegia coerulea TaxID=218851 RepID=A0A2G5CWC9_AQUCA|nr:hypothetical protein AQUCO_03500141v1 [Aquilegia coerulea]
MDDSNDEKMNIYFRLMKTIPLEVKKSDTIRKVRTEFSELEGISLVNLKSLFFAGDWLEEDKNVADYDIKNGSIINIYMDSGFRTQVYLKISHIGKRITLDVDMRDTILAVKQRIQHKEGFTVCQQDLIYLGEQLNDSRTLASYNIGKSSTIYAVFRDGDDIDINVGLNTANFLP